MSALRQFIFILCGLLAAAGPAQALLTIKITKGLESALPIAVVPFGTIENAPEGPLDIGNIIAADLARSGRFTPMDPKDMPAHPHEFSSIDFKDWRVLGMPNLVVGKVTPTGSGSYDIEFRLVDVYKAAQIVGYKVQAGRTELRLKAHQIADIIYQKLTGDRGAFATQIAYVTVRTKPDGKRSYALQIADADGYNAQTLLESPEPLMSPAWSPDGKRIAYVSFEAHNSAIYVQNLATGKRRVVASGPGINSSPAFSPDGKYLAMALSRDGNAEIYVLHLDSNRLQRMTYNPAIDTEPAWSPDGTKIAFTSDRGGTPQIYEMDLLGGKPKRLSFDGKYNASPCFSPDGKLLAMLHGGSTGYHIAVQDLRTGQLTVLTKSRLDESPSFAPNGAMILYTTVGAHGTELAAVSVDGRVRQTLALKGGEVREPAWGPFRQ